MGREIRRVPKGWEHPKDERTGHHVPMYDEVYEEKLNKWWAGRQAWLAKDIDLLIELDVLWQRDTAEDHLQATYEDWCGRAPDPESHRPDFGDTATHFQMYETVSEGTPVSPVFEELWDLADWLVTQGYSEDAAVKFCETGWVPSMMMCRKSDGSADIGMGVAALEPDFCPEGKS